MDALILDLSNVSAQILPILGAVALIFLCVLLKKIWELIDTINQSVQKLDPTIKDVEKSMEKLQAPLDTAVKYSHSLDKVHDKTSEVLTRATDFASENMNKFQTAMEEKMKKEDEVKVVEVEDKEDE